MSRPPLTTLILNSSIFSLVGIDTQFFQVNDLLRGIKLIPDGVHLFHYSDSTENGSSIRYGKWFQCKDGDIINVQFDEDNCQFTFNVNAPPSLGTDFAYMVVYPENKNKWSGLTKFVDFEAIEEYVPTNNSPISTATPLREENMVLLETLRQRDPKQTFQDQSELDLRYTIIQFRLRAPEGHGGITQNALEKSWYVRQIYGHDPELLLAEILLAFLHFVVLGNLCSCTQWLILLRLVLMSGEFLIEHRDFCDEFMSLLLIQLEKLPIEYTNSLDLLVVDMKMYTEIMESLADNVDDWNKIAEINRKKFGVEIVSRKVDADNFEVYDLDYYDEDDEDAPVVVMN